MTMYVIVTLGEYFSFTIYYTDKDHTADVQLHVWGSNMKEAFQNMAPCMLNYMTDVTLIPIDPEETVVMNVTGKLTVDEYF